MPEFIRKPLEGLFPLIPLSLHEDQEIDFGGVRRSIELVARFRRAGMHRLRLHGADDQRLRGGVRRGLRDGGGGRPRGPEVWRSWWAVHGHLPAGGHPPGAGTPSAAGADGSMLAAPYALPVTAEWALRFFVEVAESLDGEMALMLYNYSPLTGMNLTAQMWETFSTSRTSRP